MMSELREGLAKHLYGVIPFGDCTRNDAEALADSVLAYLHAHDGHAEFVQKVRKLILQAMNETESDKSDVFIVRALAVCDVELAKEQSNG